MLGEAAAAVELLGVRTREGESPWVIAGGRRDALGQWTHCANPSKSWQRIKAEVDKKKDGWPEVDISDVTIHDLRHSYGSIGAGAGLACRSSVHSLDTPRRRRPCDTRISPTIHYTPPPTSSPQRWPRSCKDGAGERSGATRGQEVAELSGLPTYPAMAVCCPATDCLSWIACPAATPCAERHGSPGRYGPRSRTSNRDARRSNAHTLPPTLPPSPAPVPRTRVAACTSFLGAGNGPGSSLRSLA